QEVAGDGSLVSGDRLLPVLANATSGAGLRGKDALDEVDDTAESLDQRAEGLRELVSLISGVGGVDGIGCLRLVGGAGIKRVPRHLLLERGLLSRLGPGVREPVIRGIGPKASAVRWGNRTAAASLLVECLRLRRRLLRRLRRLGLRQGLRAILSDGCDSHRR